MGVLVNSPAQASNRLTTSTHSGSAIDQGAIAQRLAEDTEDTEAEEDADEDTEDRIIFLSGSIDYWTADAVVLELLRLDAEDPEADIYLYISSPGGSVHAGMAIYDAIQYIEADVVTISAGFSASMAAFLLAAGTPGKRFAFPHTRVMIHKPFGGEFGEAGDLEVRASELRHITNEFYRLMSLHTGQSIPKLRRDMERDYYLGATEAIEYGIVDRVLEHKSDLDTELEAD